ncbi:MAG: ribosomal protein S18-alanine N-acetyltransferase [Candidatus Tectomicrobia bacterium]|nr:ribosomal protein S18-alanine N-acetyltransferase [Candidatus Tectomicrobia bacterium]
MEIRIEKMVEADLDEVVVIEKQSYASPWPRALFLSELRDVNSAHLLVARPVHRGTPDHVLGYICFWVVVDEAHIVNVAVHPLYRRQGIGEKLMRETLQYAREVGCLRATLEVRVSNHGAQRLYEKLGFIPVAIRKRYYSDNGEDAIVMWSSLDTILCIDSTTR